MFAGRMRGGVFPWPPFWPRDRHTAFRQAVSGNGPRGTREARSGAGIGVGAEEAHADHAEHDRGQDGLPGAWESGHGQHDHKRQYQATWLILVSVILIVCNGDRAVSAE